MALVQRKGKIALLRVHDVGTGYGPPNNFLDAEVIVRLQGGPDEAYGFKLRNDNDRPVREGMLGLLRDALAHDWAVSMDCEVDPGKTVGVIRRVALVK